MDGIQLSLYPLAPTRKILATYEEGQIKDSRYYVKLHFEQFTCVGAVEDVDDSQPNKVLVTFKDSKSECYNNHTHQANYAVYFLFQKGVLAVINNQNSCLCGKTKFTLSEYYDFMKESSNSAARSTSQQPPAGP